MDIINEKDIGSILEESNTAIIHEIIEPIEKALSHFQHNISTLSYLPDVPRIAFRIETIQKILDAFMEQQPGQTPPQILAKAGEKVGSSFADDLFALLIKVKKLPRDSTVLIKLANEFDTIAGWGKFSCELKKDQVKITIEDCFITQSKDQPKVKYADFIRGYIKGFLWSALKEHHRLFSRSVVALPNKPVTVYKDEIGCDSHSCTFKAKIREEELIEAYDDFYNCKFTLREGNIKEAMVFLRSSIEKAFKKKIGIDVDAQTSVLKIVKVFKESIKQIHYRIITDMYGSSSAELHGSRASSASEVQNLLERWGEELKKLELLYIKDEEKDKMKESLG